MLAKQFHFLITFYSVDFSQKDKMITSWQVTSRRAATDSTLQLVPDFNISTSNGTNLTKKQMIADLMNIRDLMDMELIGCEKIIA